MRSDGYTLYSSNSVHWGQCVTQWSQIVIRYIACFSLRSKSNLSLIYVFTSLHRVQWIGIERLAFTEPLEYFVIFSRGIWLVGRGLEKWEVLRGCRVSAYTKRHLIYSHFTLCHSFSFVLLTDKPLFLFWFSHQSITFLHTQLFYLLKWRFVINMPRFQRHQL